MSKTPNVGLILTDDQGYGDIACHGNSVLNTPNLDHMYSNSVRLTDFHVDPMCSPSRAALLTGRTLPGLACGAHSLGVILCVKMRTH